MVWEAFGRAIFGVPGETSNLQPEVNLKVEFRMGWKTEDPSSYFFGWIEIQLTSSCNPQQRMQLHFWSIYFSKKSPTGPTEWTPKPEYLITLAPYLGVRW